MLKAGQELKKGQYFSLKKVMNKTVEAISIFKAKFEIFTIKKKKCETSDHHRAARPHIDQNAPLPTLPLHLPEEPLPLR